MRIRKFLAGVGIITGSALASTLAFAAWNADGKGRASVAATTANKLEVSDVAVLDKLYPGATSNLSVTVKNPNSYPVKVTDIANDTAASITVTGGLGTCAANNVSFTNQSGLNVVIAPGGEQVISVPGVKMIADAANGCQGATFHFPVEAIGFSHAAS